MCKTLLGYEFLCRLDKCLVPMETLVPGSLPGLMGDSLDLLTELGNGGTF